MGELLNLDKFPEAFERFEEVVDTDSFQSFRELRLGFSFWAGRNWKNTRKQNEALRIEAVKRGISVPRETPRRRAVSLKAIWIRTVDRLGRVHYHDRKTMRYIKKP